MVEKIYIARHGFRLNWLTSTWKSPTGLPRDPPLAAYGETQAEELALHFMSLPEEERPTVIFSSPFYRCLQTVQPTAKALGLPIYIEHGIMEWYSPVVPGSGLHPRPSDAVTLQTFFPEIDPSWSTIYYPSRKGESVEQVHDRTDEFLKAFQYALDQRIPKEKQQRVLFVSHAATVITLIRSLLGDRNLAVKAGCASLSELVSKAGGSEGGGDRKWLGAWQAVKLVNGDHLKGGSSREWGFDDIEVDKGRVVEDPGEAGTEHEKDEPTGLQIHLTSNL